MAWAWNEATLFGNVGKKPELRHMDNGNAVLSFSLATNETWISKTGEKKERTDWHNIVVFGGGAEWLAEQIGKGDKIGVRGSIRTRSYEKDGQTKYITEIHVRNLDGVLLIKSVAKRVEELTDDDIPF